MKRTLIFQTVKPTLLTKEQVTIVLEGSKNNVKMFQTGIEIRLTMRGWYLAKIIKHMKTE